MTDVGEFLRNPGYHPEGPDDEPEEVARIGSLLVLDSGEIVNVDLVTPAHGSTVIRVAGSRLTVSEAQRLSDLLALAACSAL